MEKRIEDLKNNGIFKTSEINKLGYGTFKINPKIESESVKLIQKGIKIKKEADIIYKNNRKEALKLYVDSIFLYIKACIIIEEEEPQLEAVRKWRGLGKFINGVIGAIDANEDRFHMSVIQYILFNIKFHYIYIEANLVSAELKSTANLKNNTLKYFIQEHISLYNIAKFSDVENFTVLDVKILEDAVRNNIRVKNKK